MSDYLQPSNRCDDPPLLSWSWSVAVRHKPRIVVIVIVVAICGFSLLPPRPQAKAQRKQRQSRKKALLFVHLLKVLHNSSFSLQERATRKDPHPVTKICAANCVSNYVLYLDIIFARTMQMQNGTNMQNATINYMRDRIDEVASGMNSSLRFITPH